MFDFYNLWKHQKTWGFLTFLGGIEMEHGKTLKIHLTNLLYSLAE